MGIFRQFPYSNFHDMNLDEIIRIVLEMQSEWNDTKEEWVSYKEFIDNYFSKKWKFFDYFTKMWITAKKWG